MVPPRPTTRALLCAIFLLSLCALTSSESQANRGARLKSKGSATSQSVRGKAKLRPAPRRAATRGNKSAGTKTTLHFRPGAKAKAKTNLKLGPKALGSKTSANTLNASLIATPSASRARLSTRGATPRRAKPRVAKAKTRSPQRERALRNQSKSSTQARSASSRAASANSRASTRVERIKQVFAAKLESFKANPRVVRVVAVYQKTRASITRRLDAWQARAPPWAAKTMKVARTYTMPSLFSYMLSRVKSDPKFLGTYLASNSVLSNVILPGSIALGMNPVLSTVLNAFTTPMTLGVIIARERHLRRKGGEMIGFREAAKSIGNEYKNFATERMQKASLAAAAPISHP